MQAKDWGGEGGEELTGLPQMDLGAKAFSLSCEVATMANQEATRVLRPFPSSTAVTFATGSLPALTKGLRKIQPFPSSKQTWTEKSEAWGRGVCPAWAAPSSSPAPQPALILRREGTYRPRRPEWASSRGSHPWPGGALNQQQLHDLGPGPGRRLRVVGRAAGGRQPSLLQVTIEDVELRVGVVEARAGVGEHAEVHERLVHVLGQEDEAHVEDDVLHEEGVVQDQHVDEEQAHVEHRGQERRR